MTEITKVLVANRGEIACRVLRTLRELGIPSVAVYSDVDANAPHVWLADEAVALGEPRAYLDMVKLIDAMRTTGADAVHPGYGFLAENPSFAAACAEAGRRFIGPTPDAMRAFGDKRAARALAEKVGVPVIPGAQACDSIEDARVLAEDIGYPVLLKAAGGGGGKGMRRVDAADALAAAFGAATREAQSAFADPRLLVEKYIHPARHIEVQILGDGSDVVAIGERECSLQRRFQKVVEEAPAASISDATRAGLFAAAVELARAAGYASAGTVEFLVGPNDELYFLEVNTRLQVEHPVTEMLTGLDLVAEQIRVAAGGALPEVPPPRGHAIEVRLNAEDAYGGFLPASGEVLMLEWPQWPRLRVDSGIAAGSLISPHYDSLLAKIIAWGASREQARRRLLAGLRQTVLLGTTTNLAFLTDVLEHDFFIMGETFTTTLETQHWEAAQVPEVAQRAAQDALRGSGAMGGRDSTERASPWRALGPFRMGQ